jgi:hypothetical protein
MWTKQDILTDIQNRYDVVGQVSAGQPMNLPDTTKYEIPVMKAETSTTEKPIWIDTVVVFVVYKEGTDDEMARYFGSDYDTKKSTSAKVNQSSLLSYNQFYQNSIVRDKVRGAIFKVIETIHKEAETAPDHDQRLVWARNTCLTSDTVEQMVHLMTLFAGSDESIKSVGSEAVAADIVAVIEANVIKTAQLNGWIM